MRASQRCPFGEGCLCKSRRQEEGQSQSGQHPGQETQSEVRDVGVREVDMQQERIASRPCWGNAV